MATVVGGWSGGLLDVGYITYGLTFSADGLTLYTLHAPPSSSFSVEVRQWELGTAWDVNTASFVDAKSLPGARYRFLSLRPDGTSLFMLREGFNLGSEAYVERWDFGTVGDVTTLNQVVAPFDALDGLGAIPTALAVAGDGSRIVLAHDTAVYAFDMASSWEPETAEFNPDATVDYTNQLDGQIGGVAFSEDGSKLAVLAQRLNDGDTPVIVVYDLETEWNPRTPASFPTSDHTLLEPADWNPRGLALKADATVAYGVVDLSINNAQTDFVISYALTGARPVLLRPGEARVARAVLGYPPSVENVLIDFPPGVGARIGGGSIRVEYPGEPVMLEFSAARLGHSNLMPMEFGQIYAAVGFGFSPGLHPDGYVGAAWTSGDFDLPNPRGHVSVRPVMDGVGEDGVTNVIVTRPPWADLRPDEHWPNLGEDWLPPPAAPEPQVELVSGAWRIRHYPASGSTFYVQVANADDISWPADEDNMASVEYRYLTPPPTVGYLDFDTALGASVNLLADIPEATYDGMWLTATATLPARGEEGETDGLDGGVNIRLSISLTRGQTMPAVFEFRNLVIAGVPVEVDSISEPGFAPRESDHVGDEDFITGGEWQSWVQPAGGRLQGTATRLVAEAGETAHWRAGGGAYLWRRPLGDTASSRIDVAFSYRLIGNLQFNVASGTGYMIPLSGGGGRYEDGPPQPDPAADGPFTSPTYPSMEWSGFGCELDEFDTPAGVPVVDADFGFWLTASADSQAVLDIADVMFWSYRGLQTHLFGHEGAAAVARPIGRLAGAVAADHAQHRFTVVGRRRTGASAEGVMTVVPVEATELSDG